LSPVRQSSGVISVPSSPSPPPPGPRTRRIANLPGRSTSTSASIPTSGGGGGSGAGTSRKIADKEQPPSSDTDYDLYGMDELVMDDAALEALDLIEIEASGRVGGSAFGPPSSFLGSGSGSGSGSGVGSMSRSIPPSLPATSAESDVIVIDSDEDDKENVPVLTRHVRRRTQPTNISVHSTQRVDVDDDDVIDISSE